MLRHCVHARGWAQESIAEFGRPYDFDSYNFAVVEFNQFIHAEASRSLKSSSTSLFRGFLGDFFVHQYIIHHTSTFNVQRSGLRLQLQAWL
jgi:hypothetical protein